MEDGPSLKRRECLKTVTSPVAPQISDSRKFPTVSALSSKHTLPSSALAHSRKFVVKPSQGLIVVFAFQMMSDQLSVQGGQREEDEIQIVYEFFSPSQRTVSGIQTAGKLFYLVIRN